MRGAARAGKKKRLIGRSIETKGSRKVLLRKDAGVIVENSGA